MTSVIMLYEYMKYYTVWKSLQWPSNRKYIDRPVKKKQKKKQQTFVTADYITVDYRL